MAALIIAVLATPFGAIISLAVNLGDGVVLSLILMTLSMAGGAVGGAYVAQKTAQDQASEVSGGLLIFNAFLSILGGLFLGVWISMFLAIGSAGSLDELTTMVGLGLALGGVAGGLSAARSGATVGNVALGAILTGVLFTLVALKSPAGAMGGVILTVLLLIVASIGAAIGRIGAKKRVEAAAA